MSLSKRNQTWIAMQIMAKYHIGRTRLSICSVNASKRLAVTEDRTTMPNLKEYVKSYHSPSEPPDSSLRSSCSYRNCTCAAFYPHSPILSPPSPYLISTSTSTRSIP